MAKITTGQIVVPDGLVGVYRVVSLSPDGQTADIEKFDVSKQKSLGDPIRSVALNKLSAYKEDASQTAARIVREATTEDEAGPQSGCSDRERSYRAKVNSICGDDFLNSRANFCLKSSMFSHNFMIVTTVVI
jgi:hypothetical protein